jgi:hypothetical protein
VLASAESAAAAISGAATVAVARGAHADATARSSATKGE